MFRFTFVRFRPRGRTTGGKRRSVKRLYAPVEADAAIMKGIRLEEPLVLKSKKQIQLKRY